MASCIKYTRFLAIQRGLSATSGPHGVNGRLPTSIYDTSGSNTGVAITDPYLVYQSYLRQGVLDKDEAQVRAIKEFQKLYYRVVDYKPDSDINIRISLILKKLELNAAREIVENSNNGKIQLFRLSSIQNLFRKDPRAEKQQLIKSLTDEEELSQLSSPNGLLLNGEVGCGKSMLMDMFAESLPHSSKMRWHFNNFILWVYNEMHKIQNEKLFTSSVFEGSNSRSLNLENEFILFEIAQKMINKSTILLLDEFMLPDVASANVIKILFTYFFKLGGVLVATSNKLPEDLYSNEFHKKHFQSFVRILNCKCESIDMNSNVDYRYVNATKSEKKQSQLVVKMGNEDHDTKWNQLIFSLVGDEKGKSSSIKVYNRITEIPKTYKNNTCCYLDFNHICVGLYSSSDYITLASTYNTIILDNVPQLTLKMKNEARRFITLIDAIYEAKCQFYMRSKVDLEQLFFPEALKVENDTEEARIKVQEEEMFAKTVLDMEAPYRPNVSEYNKEYGNFNPEVKTNFSNTKAFTGEDEKFAYKRALSRMREMLHSEIWRRNKWVPMHDTMRPWESNPKMANGKIELYSDGISMGAKSRKFPTNEDGPVSIRNPRSDAPTIPEYRIWKLGPWTLENGKRLKNEMARRWLRSGIRDDVQQFHKRIRDE